MVRLLFWEWIPLFWAWISTSKRTDPQSLWLSKECISTPVYSGAGRLWVLRGGGGQAIDHKQWLAPPPMLCLLRAFRCHCLYIFREYQKTGSWPIMRGVARLLKGEDVPPSHVQVDNFEGRNQICMAPSYAGHLFPLKQDIITLFVNWEPEGRYHHILCTAIGSFWLSTDEFKYC